MQANKLFVIRFVYSLNVFIERARTRGHSTSIRLGSTAIPLSTGTTSTFLAFRRIIRLY